MSFCSKCGGQVPENVQFCPSCGNQIAQQQAPQPEPQPVYQQQTPQPGPQPVYQQQASQNPFDKITNTPDQTSQFDPQDIASNKGMAVLSYIGILVLIPFFAAKNSKYAQYHAKQGMNLFLVEVAWGLVSILLGFIKVQKYLWGIPYYGTPWFISLICWLGSLFLCAFAIIGIVFAASGKAKELPLFGKLHIIK